MLSATLRIGRKGVGPRDGTHQRPRSSRWKVRVLLNIATAAAVGCAANVKPPDHLVDEAARFQRQIQMPAGVGQWMASNMQTTADPCLDFYQYACGKASRNQIDGMPPHVVATVQSRLQLWSMLDAFGPGLPEGSRERLAHDFFLSCVQRTARPGSALLNPLLDQIDRIDGLESFMATLGSLHRLRLRAGFDRAIVPGLSSPPQYILALRPGTLGLSEPQAYISDTPILREARQRYREVI